jgi:hypothetical protein
MPAALAATSGRSGSGRSSRWRSASRPEDDVARPGAGGDAALAARVAATAPGGANLNRSIPLPCKEPSRFRVSGASAPHGVE